MSISLFRHKTTLVVLRGYFLIACTVLLGNCVRVISVYSRLHFLSRWVHEHQESCKNVGMLLQQQVARINTNTTTFAETKRFVQLRTKCSIVDEINMRNL